MFSRLREPFGKAGLIVAIVALVAALVGGAYAASNNGGRHHKKARHGKKKGPKFVTKPQAIAIAKKFAGTEGPAGPQGPAGANGSKGDKGDVGANGTNGADGTDGANGTNGTNGTNGESVSVSAYSGAECPGSEQGAKLTNSTGTAYACDGSNGTTGYTAVLPSEESEYGSWAVVGPSNEQVTESFSFNIPLANPIGESNVVVVNEGAEGEVGECSEGSTKGTAAAPKASPGFFCVYIGFSSGAFLKGSEGVTPLKIKNPETGESGAGKTGSVLLTEAFPGEYGYGTWAVTAPAA